MIPCVYVRICFEPHKDDVSELYESVRASCETLRPFGITHMNFEVTMKDNDDEELPTF